MQFNRPASTYIPATLARLILSGLDILTVPHLLQINMMRNKHQYDVSLNIAFLVGVAMQPTPEFAAIQGIKVPPAVFSDHEIFIETTRKGLSGTIVKQAVEALGHRDLFVRLLETTAGNLNRFYRRKSLNSYHSEGILDTLRVFSKANSVLGDPDVAREWMDTAIPALGGQTPISLCDTFEGRNLVQVALRKIEYGEFV